jgi:hypothetical protein
VTFLLYLLGLLFISAVAVFVAAPLFTPRASAEPLPESESQSAPWEKQKTEAYAAIKEADFDLQMGKLTPEDYQRLREKYEARALEALAQLDRLSPATDKIEREKKPASLNEA